MGLVRRCSAAALLVLIAVATSCKDEPNAGACDVFCSDLELCRLLPSPLGFGDNAEARQRNCVDRCNSTGSPPGKPVECRHAASDPPPAWCADGCAKLAACINNDFPAGEATGKGQVILQVRVDPMAASANTTCVEGSMTDPAVTAPGMMTSGARDACAQVALDQVFLIAPGAPGMTGSPFDMRCKDAINVPFPTLSTHAGLFKASLKLTGHTTPTPSENGGQGGGAGSGGAGSSGVGAANAGAGGTLSADSARATTVCRVMSLGDHNALAGTPTALYAVVPGSWASEPTFTPCESSCFDGNDEDHDGRTDCDDPACAEKCQACTHVVKDGRAVPDCSDPDCGCVTPVGAGGLSGGGGADASGGAGGKSGGSAGAAVTAGTPGGGSGAGGASFAGAAATAGTPGGGSGVGGASFAGASGMSAAGGAPDATGGAPNAAGAAGKSEGGNGGQGGT